jgi:hypothetical protein
MVLKPQLLRTPTFKGKMLLNSLRRPSLSQSHSKPLTTEVCQGKVHA